MRAAMTMACVLHGTSSSRCQIPDQLKCLRVPFTTILGCCLDRWLCTGSTLIVLQTDSTDTTREFSESSARKSSRERCEAVHWQ